MRVLQVIESFGAGSMQVAATISRGLATGGHSVAIAHGQVAETPADVTRAIGAGIETFPIPWGRRPQGQIGASRALRRLVDRWRPDVIHLHSSFAGAVGALALRGRAPLVYTPHGYSFIRLTGNPLGPALWRWVEARLAARVDVVAAVSEYEAGLARSIGAPSVTVVRNGIPELDAPPVAHAAADPPEVVAVGRLDPARRPVAAAGILAGIGDLARVTWVGGPVDGTSAGQVRAHGVEVTGWIDREAVLERLGRATACLHWSAWDSQPLAVLEAISQDAVVVASDIPANRELLGPEAVCVDAAGAVDRLRRALTDPGWREARLAHQRETGRRYGAREMVSSWSALYASLGGGR